MKKTDVHIIGAGPAGLVGALCLAKLGISSVIVEKNAGVNKHPKAHELNARSIEILEELDISTKELIKEASPFSDGARILFCQTIKEEYGRIDLFADEERRAKYNRHLKSKTPYLNLSQTELEKILLRKVMENPLIELLNQHQWQSLRQEDTYVQSEVLDLKKKLIFNIQSQYVLAADGAGSQCRKFLKIPLNGPDKVDEFVSAYFENNLRDYIATPAKLYWMFNPEAAGTFIAHHIDKRWVYMFPVFLDFEKKETFDKVFLENRIKKALGDKNIDVNVKSIAFWQMSAQVAEKFQKDRVILVGDAAHRFPPTGGLGMNTGIADAHNICWKLAMVLNGFTNQDFLETYEQERKPIAEQNCEQSLYNYHKILEIIEVFGLGRNDLKKLAKFKNTAAAKWLPSSWLNKIISMGNKIAQKKMNKFHSDPILKEKVFETINDQIPHFDRIGLDIGYSYEKGAIIQDGTDLVFPEDRVTQYLPSTRPGSRFPHFDFKKNTFPTSTHDLLDYHFYTLLIRAKGDSWKIGLAQLPTIVQEKTKVIPINELDLSETIYKKLIALLEINETGALLIRPDGHVAWRVRAFHGNHKKKLLKVFQNFFNIT